MGSEGTAGMENADVADCHEAVRENGLEEPAEKLSGVEGGGSWACTARLTIGDGAGVVCEAHDASVGDGAPADRGGEVLEGRVAMGMGLTVDVPGDVPALGVEVRQQSSVAHVFCEDGSGDGGEGLHGHREGGAGGAPGRAVRCEATAGHTGVEVGGGLALSSPGVQDAGPTGAVRAAEVVVAGAACVGARLRTWRGRRGVDASGAPGVGSRGRER